MKNKDEVEEVNLEKSLDDALEVLQKAAGGETLSKSDADKESNKGSEEEEANKGGEAEANKGGEAESMKGDDEEDDEDEDAKKKGFKKSVEENLTKSAAVQNAVEVSKFLKEFVKSQADIMGNMVYRMKRLEKSNRSLSGALAKSVGAQNDMLKSFGSDIKTVGGRPQPRKSIESSNVSSLEKGFRNNDGSEGKTPEGQLELSKSQVANKMANLEMEQKIPSGSTSKYEMCGEMSKSVESVVLSAK